MPIHVAARYRVTADLTPADIAHAASLLDRDERARFDRFRFDEDRRDYAAAHALLRVELSRHAGAAPEAWRFGRDAHDKPSIVAPAHHGISFSLSHCRGLVACIVATGPAVGIDVERIDREVDETAIARRFFSNDEHEALQRLERGPERRARFFELWTLKEAYAKAVGLGLAQPLGDIAFDIDAPRRVRFRPASAIDASEWQFAMYEPVPAARLAIAIQSCEPVEIELSRA